ncbi:enolase C-terminal domain-like protein [Salipiger sp.]|uniref:enolase C-terminal domain-like protein n=1 Tax=Salipiger sp. TaxID=2078585 RepID=UPI003A976579
MAKIERVEIIEYTFRVENLGSDSKHNRVYSKGAVSEIGNFVVSVTDCDGAVGQFAPGLGGKLPHLGQVLFLAPLLPGRDGAEREGLFNDFKKVLRHFGGVGVSHLDCALWDLAGRRAGLSVAEMLGAHRWSLPAYASAIHADDNGGLDSPEAFIDFVEQCHDLGYRAFKIHGWTAGDADREIRNVLALGRHFGDRMTFMLDLGCEILTYSDALRIGRACDEAGFAWIEDPYRDNGTSQHAHRMLRDKIATPILAMEHVRGLEPKADWIAAGATDLVRADPEYDLGITGTMKTAHLAEAFGLDCEVHSAGPAHRACMSAMRNSNWYELALVGPGIPTILPPIFAPDYSDALDAVRPDGTFPVPRGPGLGVTIDEAFLAARETRRHVFTA